MLGPLYLWYCLNGTWINILAFKAGFSLKEWLIYCIAHIINLCVRAMLYGLRQENYASIIAANGNNQGNNGPRLGAGRRYADKYMQYAIISNPHEDFIISDSALEEIRNINFRVYSQRGFLGIIDNTGVQLRTSSQLHEQFIQSQQKASPGFLALLPDGTRIRTW